MSVLLSVFGVISVLAGAAAISFGIPVKEFSFGNTLIESGVVALVGGLIVIGLGAAVSQLHRVVEMLGARPLSRAGRGLEPFEVPARIPFPPKPKSEAKAEAQHAQPAEPPVLPPTAEDKAEMEPELDLPPALRNPDAPLMAETEVEDMPLSPREAVTATPRLESPERSESNPSPRHSAAAVDMAEPKSFEQPAFAPPWRSSPARQERPSSFDSMWPAEPSTSGPHPAEPLASRAETIPRAGAVKMTLPEPEAEYEPEPEVRAVAILKSGVVDGMGYTLYVDGSIEAELPDGTLRFGSINELRAHLEANS